MLQTLIQLSKVEKKTIRLPSRIFMVVDCRPGKLGNHKPGDFSKKHYKTWRFSTKLGDFSRSFLPPQ